MPTYGYECLGCHAQFEIVQSIKDNALTTCEACGGTLRKRIYPVGIAFKGDGFYVNDYAPKAAAAPSAPKADAAAAPASSEAKPADAKADTPKPDAPKADAPKADAPKADTPKAPAAA